MKKNILSKVGSDAAGFLFSKKPSDFIPFKGNFPILEDYQHERWQNEFDTHMFLEDCSEWFQETIAKARRMSALDTGFRQYLKETGDYNNFDKMKAAEKADLLVKFLNKENLSLEYLRV